MKKAMKLMIGLVVMVTAIQVQAEGSLKAEVVGEKKLKVEVSNIKGQAISYIQDSKGRLVYEKKVEEENMGLAFDLSLVRPGSYEFIVKDDVKFQSIPFEVTAQSVLVVGEEQIKTFFPTMTMDEQSVAVKLISDEENDLYINIKSEEGKVLVTEKVEGKLGLIGKKFKFEPGNYTMTLSSNAYAKTTFLSFE